MTTTTVDVGGRAVTLDLDDHQLAARGEGDLITAVIVSVAPVIDALDD